MIATMLLLLVIFAGLWCVYTGSRPLALASGVLASVLFAAWGMLLNEGFSKGHLFDNWKYPVINQQVEIKLIYLPYQYQTEED